MRNLTLSLSLALALAAGPCALAQDQWRFGIGTGISSFSLDGDIGFRTPSGTVLLDVDLGNDDTSDLLGSALGVAGYAAKGRWKLLYLVATRTLEDDAPGFDAEWDSTRAGLVASYTVARSKRNGLAVLFGARHIEHDWSFVGPSGSFEVDEGWTDAIIGLAHSLRIDEKWTWFSSLDAGFGESEGQVLVRTAIDRRIGEHWAVNLFAGLHRIEFGEIADAGQPDFYLFDVDEPQFGLGFTYNW